MRTESIIPLRIILTSSLGGLGHYKISSLIGDHPVVFLNVAMITKVLLCYHPPAKWQGGIITLTPATLVASCANEQVTSYSMEPLP